VKEKQKQRTNEEIRRTEEEKKERGES